MALLPIFTGWVSNPPNWLRPTNLWRAKQAARLAKRLAQWLWRRRAVKRVDGTYLSMLDTTRTTALYLRPSPQALGVGFPVARLVMVICLASGAGGGGPTRRKRP